MLRPFKAYVSGLGLESGDQIVYYGCPGTCTPFIELLAYGIRDLPVEQVFVPYLDEEKARTLIHVEDVGMQAGEPPATLKPELVVLLGGLSMPNVPVTAEQAKSVVSAFDAPVAGVCFMKMFERAGWLDVFDFDLLIDATFYPVDVWTE